MMRRPREPVRKAKVGPEAKTAKRRYPGKMGKEEMKAYKIWWANSTIALHRRPIPGDRRGKSIKKKKSHKIMRVNR